MKRALMACAVLAILALPFTALADNATKAAGTAATTTAKAEMTKSAADMAGHLQKLAGATWVDAPGYPAGCKMAALHKDATIACAYLKFPAGAKIAAHTHPAAHYATVISGTGTFGFGTDPTKGTPMNPGDFVYVPAGAPHWVTATTEVIVFGSMIGPEGTTYVNPADDPAKGSASN